MKDKRRGGFTLVELLVVIGIIAVLVGILLPALASARRQANTVKCETALREIGHAFQMYAIDHKGWYPPAKAGGPPGSWGYRLSFSDVDTSTQDAVYWTGFLARYVTKAALSTGTNTVVSETAAADARKTVFWGCPSFDGYVSGEVGGVYKVQTGYGMNPFPEYSPSNPKPNNPPNVIGDPGFDGFSPRAVAVVHSNNNWATILNDGTWYKQNAWTRPSQRALVADTIYWLLEVQAAPLNGVIPGQRVVNNNPSSTTWYSPTSNGQTLYDFYRHGKYPGIEAADANLNGHYGTSGGKVAYNVLFADGHVATLNSREDGYRAARLRFPG